MFERILVANDGSPGGMRALEAAIRIARGRGNRLHMVSVEELPRFATSIDEVVEDKEEANHRFAELAERARAKARAQRVHLEIHLLAGHVVPAIVDLIARERFDLLVIGYMGHSALYNRIIGSTTDRLVELAPCAVLVVK
jgi:nucleotide-binding universal stress UspA family protein